MIKKALFAVSALSLLTLLAPAPAEAQATPHTVCTFSSEQSHYDSSSRSDHFSFRYDQDTGEQLSIDWRPNGVPWSQFSHTGKVKTDVYHRTFDLGVSLENNKASRYSFRGEMAPNNRSPNGAILVALVEGTQIRPFVAEGTLVCAPAP
jgi:hypothetical protein